MGLGVVEIFLLLIVVFVFFGAGRLPHVMGDFAKGIKAFKENLKDDDDDVIIVRKKKAPAKPVKKITKKPAQKALPAPKKTVKKKR